MINCYSHEFSCNSGNNCTCLAFLKDKLHLATPRAITHPSKKCGLCNYFLNCTQIHSITITNNESLCPPALIPPAYLMETMNIIGMAVMTGVACYSNIE